MKDARDETPNPKSASSRETSTTEKPVSRGEAESAGDGGKAAKQFEQEQTEVTEESEENQGGMIFHRSANGKESNRS
jgi:hypothetical protein